ncbi:glycosyltransferase [Candidatus Methylospira mobilis]|uniref:Glycosyltransferase n=1 Tax=Candidatus Methylospira mobilis TaxID=1808979 RepID=A0A5Q0BPT0_9GAMM|nr:glycosyltransferase [Candidatus Methylospira mobilis]
MKVSIITPSFNQGQFIERTLQSVADQTGAEIEHVVFDGGSTDKTIDILKRYGSSIRWESRKDKGQADAVNKGISATDGDIIGWLNSDDIYYPGAIAKIVAFFNDHPDIDLVYGMADHIDTEDKVFESYPTEPWSYQRLKETCIICQPAAFFRRSVVEQLGLLDETLNYCMDYEYWLRLAEHGIRFAYLEGKLAGSRLYAENKTLSARVAVREEINDMFKKKFGAVPIPWLCNYAHVVVGSRIGRISLPIFHAPEVGIRAILAELRWNKRVTFAMLKHFLRRI